MASESADLGVELDIQDVVIVIANIRKLSFENARFREINKLWKQYFAKAIGSCCMSSSMPNSAIFCLKAYEPC